MTHNKNYLEAETKDDVIKLIKRARRCWVCPTGLECYIKVAKKEMLACAKGGLSLNDNGSLYDPNLYIRLDTETNDFYFN